MRVGKNTLVAINCGGHSDGPRFDVFGCKTTNLRHEPAEIMLKIGIMAEQFRSASCQRIGACNPS